MKTLLKLNILFLSLLTFQNAEARDLKHTSTMEIIKHFDCQDQKCGRFINRHLIRDLKLCQIHPEAVSMAPEYMEQGNRMSKEIRGRVAYIGFFMAPYRYQGKLMPDGSIKITANVYFTNHKNISPEILEDMQDKLDQAAELWNNSVPYEYKLTFDFQITKKRKGSSVRAKLVKGWTRGPYFSKWSYNRWSYRVVAHEMGHVLGLDDEYSNNPFGGSTGGCIYNSLMCTGKIIYPWHYYLVTRRLLCGI